MLIRSHHTHSSQRLSRSPRTAFTLLEVLVVVAIIVMLAGIGTYYLMPRLEEAKVGRARVDIAKLSGLAEQYAINHGGNFPQSIEALCEPQPSSGAPLANRKEIMDPWNKPYRLDPSGTNNGGNKPDISTVSPKGLVIGNWE